MSRAKKVIHTLCIIVILILVHINSRTATITKMNNEQLENFKFMSTEELKNLRTQIMVRDTIITELNRLIDK